MQNAAFFVRDISIYGDLILAPMDGISDPPFRSLTRRLGSAMSYTQFINARDVIEGHPHLARRLVFADFERPVAFQLFDDDPSRLIAAARQLEKYRPDILDVNLGCAARTVTNRGAGAALLRQPQKIEQIFSCLSSSLSLPITAKMRLGWDADSRNYLDIARIIEENGGQLIAVHARTKQQNYSEAADWDAIAEIKQVVKIPVIANGDVFTVQDIDRILRHTRCDGVMIGRAAIGNPWIFSRRELSSISLDDVHALLAELVADMAIFYGDERGVLHFRKFAKQILSDIGFPQDQLRALITLTTAEQVQTRLNSLFEIMMQCQERP